MNMLTLFRNIIVCGTVASLIISNHLVHVRAAYLAPVGLSDSGTDLFIEKEIIRELGFPIRLADESITEEELVQALQSNMLVDQRGRTVVKKQASKLARELIRREYTSVDEFVEQHGLTRSQQGILRNTQFFDFSGLATAEQKDVPPSKTMDELKSILADYIWDVIAGTGRDNEVLYLDPSRFDDFCDTNGIVRDMAYEVLLTAGFATLIDDWEDREDDSSGMVSRLLTEDSVDSMHVVQDESHIPVGVIISLNSSYHVRIPDGSGRVISSLAVTSRHQKDMQETQDYQKIVQENRLDLIRHVVKSHSVSIESFSAQCWILKNKDQLIRFIEDCKGAGASQTICKRITERLFNVPFLSDEEAGLTEPVFSVLKSDDYRALRHRIHDRAARILSDDGSGSLFSIVHDNTVMYCQAGIALTGGARTVINADKSFCRWYHIPNRPGVYITGLAEYYMDLDDDLADFDEIRGRILNCEVTEEMWNQAEQMSNDACSFFISELGIPETTVDAFIHQTQRHLDSFHRVYALLRVLTVRETPPYRTEIIRLRIKRIKEALKQIRLKLVDGTVFDFTLDNIPSLKKIEKKMHSDQESLDLADINDLINGISKKMNDFKYRFFTYAGKEFCESAGIAATITEFFKHTPSLLTGENQSEVKRIAAAWNKKILGIPGDETLEYPSPQTKAGEKINTLIKSIEMMRRVTRLRDGMSQGGKTQSLAYAAVQHMNDLFPSSTRRTMEETISAWKGRIAREKDIGTEEADKLFFYLKDVLFLINILD
ncbi:MAG: hypothetical protein GF384_00130, partial [Elusimicrobia bacterium]|nr:hypothetical protein [Elusimicrobiota bacterium]